MVNARPISKQCPSDLKMPSAPHEGNHMMALPLGLFVSWLVGPAMRLQLTL
jgi:hypothetical protein